MEMIVAIFVFSLVMTTVMATFTSVVTARKRTKAIQQDVEDARYAMELMAKTLRTSSVLSATATDLQMFDYSQSQCTEYKYDNVAKKLGSLSGTWTNSAIPNVTPACTFSGISNDMTSGFVGSANFSAISSAPAPSKKIGKVTIAMKVCYNKDCSTDAPTIQTTVSLRDYQEVNP